jgi:hypothetical protein
MSRRLSAPPPPPTPHTPSQQPNRLVLFRRERQHRRDGRGENGRDDGADDHGDDGDEPPRVRLRHRVAVPRRRHRHHDQPQRVPKVARLVEVHGRLGDAHGVAGDGGKDNKRVKNKGQWGLVENGLEGKVGVERHAVQLRRHALAGVLEEDAVADGAPKEVKPAGCQRGEGGGGV